MVTLKSWNGEVVHIYNLTLTFYSWRLHLQLKILKWCSSLKVILLNKKKMSHKLLFSTEIIFCSKLKTQSINITGFLSRELPDTKIHPHCCSLFGSDAEVYDPILKKKRLRMPNYVSIGYLQIENCDDVINNNFH